MQSVLTAVQLLWLNLIMDTLAALALATDPPTEKILDRPPQPKSAPLITINMWKMIIGQAIFQMAITCVLHFAGDRIFDWSDEVLDTIVFNTFVWMQIFNEFNNRRLDNKFNIFEGLHRNKFFIVINCIMVGCQVAIIFVGGQVFTVVPLKIEQWLVCLIPAVLSLPWAILLRLFPDELFAKIARIVGAPVLVVYRPMARCWSRIGRGIKKMAGKVKPAKDAGVATETEENTEPHAREVVYGGAPELIVSEADAAGPTINIEDVERGPS
jgi:Ca2+-transporting ATPase